ncbi:hypothetical protein DENSPDRAFT_872218 [Dentipellis sp. KUC8613]|nr:hypothetical protein DENSPDRAFT_872218 [Dentipellis sp. KUC8613]
MPARPIHEMSASPHSRRLAVATVLGIAGTAAAMYTGALDIKRDKQPQSVNGTSRTHSAYPYSPAYPDPHAARPKHRVAPAIIPDLRFESTYLRRVAPHVHVERVGAQTEDKGKGKEVVKEPYESIKVEWGKVVWITTRDQIISPLVQGALWGTASVFLVPMFSALGARVRHMWPQYREPPVGHEGKGVGWLRSWFHSLLGSAGFGIPTGTK